MKIRRILSSEMDQVTALAEREGWNPGIHDAALFYHTDPGGFFMMENEGVMAGCISAVAYDDAFGFIGLYIMKPEFRGLGLGIRLWNHALAYLGDRNTGLDGVVEQQENYKKTGFKLAYNNIRFQYINPGTSLTTDAVVVPLETIPFPELVAFDRDYFPAGRDLFLKHWIGQPSAIALGYRSQDSLAGYIVLRKCVDGCKAGPLFASDPIIARALWEAALSRLPEGAAVYLDIPEPNKDAMALAAQYKMVKVFETARMYNKAEPAVNLPGIYGVTTFELG